MIEATFALRLFTESPAGFGYLLKDRVLDVDDFVDALRRVVRGGTAIDPSNAGIGHKLFLSPKTVETHVHAIFSKLDLAAAPDDYRRVLAVLAFLER